MDCPKCEAVIKETKIVSLINVGDSFMKCPSCKVEIRIYIELNSYYQSTYPTLSIYGTNGSVGTGGKIK